MALKKRTIIIIAAVGTLLGLLLGIMLVTIIRLAISSTSSEKPMSGIPTENLTINWPVDKPDIPTPYISRVTEKHTNHRTTTESSCHCPCSCNDPTAIKNYSPSDESDSETHQPVTCKPSEDNEEIDDGTQEEKPEEKPEEMQKEKPEEKQKEKPEEKQKEKKKKKEKSEKKVYDSDNRGKPETGGKDKGKNVVDEDMSKSVGESNEIIKDVPEGFPVSPEPEILEVAITEEKINEKETTSHKDTTKSEDAEEKPEEVWDVGDHESEDYLPDDEEYDEDYGDKKDREDKVDNRILGRKANAGDNRILGREDSTGDDTQYIDNESDSDNNSKQENAGNKGKADQGTVDKGKADRGTGDKGKADHGAGNKGKADHGAGNKGKADGGTGDKGK